MDEHSPEPWRADGQSTILDANGQEICAFTGEWGETMLSEGNRRRIIACVNACEKMPTEMLEQTLGVIV